MGHGTGLFQALGFSSEIKEDLLAGDLVSTQTPTRAEKGSRAALHGAQRGVPQTDPGWNSDTAPCREVVPRSRSGLNGREVGVSCTQLCPVGPGHSPLVRVVGSCERVHLPSVLIVAGESQSPGDGVGHSAASEQKPEGAEGDLRTPAPAGGRRGGTEGWLRGDWPDF